MAKYKEELSILVLDGSGSMGTRDAGEAGGKTRAEAVEDAVRQLAEELNRTAVPEERYLAIIGYDQRSEPILDPTCITDLRSKDPKYKELPPIELPPLDLSRFGGTTAIGNALRRAREMAETWLKGQVDIERYVTICLLSDGFENENTEPEKVAEEIKHDRGGLKLPLNRPEILIATVAYGRDPQLQQYHEALRNMSTEWNEQRFYGEAVNGAQLKKWLTPTIVRTQPAG